MKNKKFLRKRKFYMVLPLLVLPFVTLAFWAMGGGKGNSEPVKTTTGLNLQLPDAKLKDEKDFDKLSFYNQAEKDSLKNEEALRNDPGYKGMSVLEPVNSNNAGEQNRMITSPFSSNGLDANEQKIYKKINELNQQINRPEQTLPASKVPNEDFSSQVDKLQSMMQTMNDKGNDPEMQQIGNMLDKIMDVQHPELIKDRSVKNKDQVFSVSSRSRNEVISLLQRQKADTVKRVHNHFYEQDNSLPKDTNKDPAIEAVVHQSQTIVSGSALKLRLLNDVYINGTLIPAGNFIYGIASLENERVGVTIHTIRYRDNLFPVSLQLYDLDGIAGIHIPGSISRDVAKQSSEQSLQNIEITALDPSLAAQAANTGIQAAKSLLSKKVKEIKVTLKAGYKVLLKDNNKQNN